MIRPVQIKYFSIALIFLSFLIPDLLSDYYRDGFEFLILGKTSIKKSTIFLLIAIIPSRTWKKGLFSILFFLNLINLVWVLIFHSSLTMWQINVILGANRDDFNGLLNGENLLLLAGSIGLAFAFTYLVVKNSKVDFLKSKPSKITVGIFLIISTGAFLRNPSVRRIAGYHHSFALAYCFYDQYRLHQLVEARNDIEFHLTKAQRTENQIHVLIIGETLRSDHLQINGYSRNTTPKLSSTQGLINYNNSVSGSGTTRISIPLLLTDIMPSEWLNYYKRPSLINIFKSWGIHTFWISNQSNSLAEFDLLLNESDSLIRVNHLSDDRSDANTIKILESISKSNYNSLIVIHLNGNHYPYGQNYDDQFDKFGPDDYKNLSIQYSTELINSYDNSILQTDYVVSEIINTIDKLNVPASIIFTSDHGESLFENNNPQNRGHGLNLNKPNFMVPLMFWTSEEYQDKFPEISSNLQINSSKPTHVDHIFHTVLQMNQIKYHGLDETKSLASPSFIPYIKRQITGFDEVIFFEDLPEVNHLNPSSVD